MMFIAEALSRHQREDGNREHLLECIERSPNPLLVIIQHERLRHARCCFGQQIIKQFITPRNCNLHHAVTQP
jgi:hypothetical protein